jgi:hypothetical protein
MKNGLPSVYEQQAGPGRESIELIGRSCASPQEMENERDQARDQADDQQDVNNAGANVNFERAQQPENNQNQGNKRRA